jgi:hypothetical protein
MRQSSRAPFLNSRNDTDPDYVRIRCETRNGIQLWNKKSREVKNMNLRVFALILFIPASATAIEGGGLKLSDAETEMKTVLHTADRTVLNLSLGSLEVKTVGEDDTESYRISLPGELGNSRGAYLGAEGVLIPTVTRSIAIPFDSDPTFRVTKSDFVEFRDISLAGASEEELASYSAGESEFELVLRDDPVAGGVAGVMRDVRVYSLTFSPVKYDADRQSLKVYDEIEVEIDHAGSEMFRYGNRISEAFLPIYRALYGDILVFDPIEITRGANWFIYPDAYFDQIQPIVEWEKAKGYPVEMIAKSDIGSNPSYIQIKNYIQARYDTCLVKPDYITIIGDVNMPSGYGIPTRSYANPYGFGDIESDNYYTFLEGGDYFPEVLIGRISIDNTSDLSNYSTKFFQYERTPYMDNTGWYLKGTMVCYWEEDSWYDFTSPRITKLWCRGALLESGFTRVDTLFQHPGHYISAYEINNSINGGVAYVNYRGYGDPYGWTYPDYTYSDFYGLSNGPMYPIMTSVVCGTGDYDDYVDVCFGEHWIRDPGKGGAGFVGNSNHDAHTIWTNALDVGTYWGLFSEGVSTLAQAQLMGKMTLYDAFPADRGPNGQVELYFNSYNVLGDPELNCWTTVPKQMNVVHDDSVAFGQNVVSVAVEDEAGAGLEGAYVCIWKEGDIFQGGFTATDGTIDFMASPAESGAMAITVTARNHIPYEDSVIYYNSEMAVGYESHIIDDDSEGESSGNGDGVPNPSETIELSVALKNFSGSLTATGVTAALSSASPFVEITRESADYSDIAPGEIADPDQPFLFNVAADAPNGFDADLQLDIADDSGDSWDGIVQINFEAAELNVDDVVILDGDDGVIDPGEAFEVKLTVVNSGDYAISGASAVLRTSDDQVTVIDSAAVFGDCAPGGSFDNSGDHFIVAVDDDIYVGHLINFSLEFTGSEQQTVTTGFGQQVGEVTSVDPIGPDNYGYYCFDNTDQGYSDHPTYDWIDIDTQNWDYVQLDDDDAGTIPLPFQITYYGQRFTSLTVCDNGFAALGDTWWNAFDNTNIPAPQNAPAMVAPFWDDFVQYNLRIYYHHDQESGRFIVGWNNVFDDEVSRYETFEVIFLDTDTWPTLTGDNEIIFQYEDVNSPYSSSVGICSPDRHDGIQYSFNGDYADGAATLVDGRAIKFTTGSLYPTGADEGGNLPGVFSLSQNYPNPFNASTIIEFYLPEAGDVRLELYNVLGQKLGTLVDGRLESGNHSVTWNSGDLTSGIYFYRLKSGNLSETKRMLLLR